MSHRPNIVCAVNNGRRVSLVTVSIDTDLIVCFTRTKNKKVCYELYNAYNQYVYNHYHMGRVSTLSHVLSFDVAAAAIM